MRDTALCVPLLWRKVVPVIHVLIQELGLGVVHTIKTEAVKVLLNLFDSVLHDKGPVSTTVGAFLVSLRQIEVCSKGLKVLADEVDRFAALLVDRISTSLHKCLEVLKDSLFLATTPGTDQVA